MQRLLGERRFVIGEEAQDHRALAIAAERRGDALGDRPPGGDGKAMRRRVMLHDRQQIVLLEQRLVLENGGRHHRGVARQRQQDIARQVGREFNVLGQHQPHQRLGIVEHDAERVDGGMPFELVEAARGKARRDAFERFGALRPGALLDQLDNHLARHRRHRPET